MAPSKNVKKANIAPSSLSISGNVVRALLILACAAVYSPVSQLTLSPVYGSIPSAQFHHVATALITLLALTRRQLLSRWIPQWASNILPVLAFWIPAIQYMLFRNSTQLGSTFGPLITESVTYLPLLILSSYSTSSILVRSGVHQQLHHSFGETVLGLAAYGFFTSAEANASFVLHRLFTLSSSFTRTSIQLSLAGAYAVLCPSKLLVLTIPAILHTVWMNPHFETPYTTNLLNTTLQTQQWSLLERAESVTGYVSVLENLDMQYRVLRCDHSLLGGEWLVTNERRKQGITVSEPIYAVFEMLEAVRLVQVAEDSKTDSEKSALVVGLGIGTAPKALLAHGIATTIIELDPMVHFFATKYFALPTNHTAVLQDAVAWVSATSQAATTQYDYIIHDVFTGGAEPLPLFTSEFLTDLRSLLLPNGVIAINYAGDLSTLSTKQVLNTVATVFGRQCRIFRDTPPSASTEDDFLNMVVFCSNAASAAPLTFRKPVEADFLGSTSRRHYLAPQAALEIAFPAEEELEGESVSMLMKGNMKVFEKGQVESARRHWGIMRKVVPAFVWENW